MVRRLNDQLRLGMSAVLKQLACQGCSYHTPIDQPPRLCVDAFVWMNAVAGTGGDSSLSTALAAIDSCHQETALLEEVLGQLEGQMAQLGAVPPSHEIHLLPHHRFFIFIPSPPVAKSFRFPAELHLNRVWRTANRMGLSLSLSLSSCVSRHARFGPAISTPSRIGRTLKIWLLRGLVNARHVSHRTSRVLGRSASHPRLSFCVGI